MTTKQFQALKSQMIKPCIHQGPASRPDCQALSAPTSPTHPTGAIYPLNRDTPRTHPAPSTRRISKPALPWYDQVLQWPSTKTDALNLLPRTMIIARCRRQIRDDEPRLWHPCSASYDPCSSRMRCAARRHQAVEAVWCAVRCNFA